MGGNIKTWKMASAARDHARYDEKTADEAVASTYACNSTTNWSWRRVDCCGSTCYAVEVEGGGVRVALSIALEATCRRTGL